ncbi:MAG: FtsX-like permease family protein, partial [Acidimicrobiales bacterium]
QVTAILITDHLGTVAVVSHDDALPSYRRVAGAIPPTLAADEALVSTTVARRRHLAPGSVLQLPGVARTVSVVVSAVWEDSRFHGIAVTIAGPTLAAGWGPQPPEEVYVTPATGISPAELAARLKADPQNRHLVIRSPDQLAADVSSATGRLLSPFRALQRALLVVAVIATISTLILVSLHRRQELAMLAAVGMSPGQLGLVMLAQAGVAAAVGGVLGAVGAIPVLLAVRSVSPFLIGVRPRLDLAIAPTVFSLILVSALLMAAAALPAFRVAHMRVRDALAHV